MSGAPSLRHEDGGNDEALPPCSTAHDEDGVDSAALLFVGTTPWTKVLVTHLLAEAIFSLTHSLLEGNFYLNFVLTYLYSDQIWKSIYLPCMC